MIHFLVVAGSAPAVDRFADRVGPSVDRSRINTGEVVEARAPGGSWALAAIEVPDPLSKDRLAVDGDSFAVVNGPVVPTVPGEAAQVALAAHRSGGGAALDGVLGGSWNAVASTPGRGLCAMSDFSGICPLYWRFVGDVLAVSNRASTLAHLDGEPTWDPLALSWIVSLNRHFGEDMPVTGVRHLRSDDELSLPTGASRPVVSPAPRHVWPAPDSPPGRDDLTPAEWDEVTDRLVESVRRLGTLHASPERPLDLMLTGGKDSRLCLALAKGAGILDSVRLVTNGGPDSPEVRAATEVARAIGCSHHRADAKAGKLVRVLEARGPDEVGVDPSTPEPAGASAGTGEGRRRRGAPATPWQRDHERVWQLLREGVHRYDGAMSLWDGVTAAHEGPARMAVKGFGGELYRTHQHIDDGRPPRRAGWPGLLRFERRVNPVGIVRRDVESAHWDWLSDFAADARRRTRADLAPDLLRAVNNVGHWNGLMAQATPGVVEVNPLLDPAGFAANAKLNGPARHRERFHHEVVRRLAPELVEVPFHAGSWKTSLRAQAELTAAGRRATLRERLRFEGQVSKDRARNLARIAALTRGMQAPVRASRRRLPGMRSSDKALASWQWGFLSGEGDAIAAVVERAGDDAGLDQICAMDRLLPLVRRTSSITDDMEAHTVMGALSASIALLDEHAPFTDDVWG